MHEASEAEHEHGQADHGEERDGREQRADADHHDHREQPAEDRVHEVHHGWSGGHPDGPQIIREAGHEIPGAPSRIPTGVEDAEAGEDVVAEVGLDAATDSIQQRSHGEAEHAARDGRDQHYTAEAHDGATVSPGADLVDTALQEGRNDAGQQGRHHYR